MTRLNPDYAAWRRVFIRTMASLACIAAVVGLGGTLYAYRQIDRAERSARLQIHQLDAIVAQLAVTLRTTGTTAANAAASVDAAKTTLATTASTTRDAAVTLDNTGTTVDIAIPGFGHPFADVKEELHDLSIQLGAVATDLDLTGTALIQNGRDLHAINADVADLAAQMDDTAAEIRRFADAGGTLSSLALTARLLLGWVVVLHLILLGLGLALGCLTVESVAPAHSASPESPSKADN